MLKSGDFKVQLHLIAKKRKCGSILLDRSRIRLDRLKIAGLVFLQNFQIGPSPQKRLGFHLNFSIYKRETLATFWRLFGRLVCYFLWDLRGFVPSNYTRFYWSKNYNQVLVEHSCCIKIITDGDLKPLSGISKSQARLL